MAKHFLLSCSKLLFLTISICTCFAQASNLPDSKSLMVSIGTPIEIAETVQNSLEAIKDSGKVIFVVYRKEDLLFIKKYVAGNFPTLKDKVLIFQEQNPSYPYIRDLGSGWEKLNDGKYRLINNSGANASDQTSRIVNLVAYCTNRKIEFATRKIPWERKPIGDFTPDGGNFVSDGAGTCLVVDNDSTKNINLRLNCKKIIVTPPFTAESNFRHPNHHNDVYAAFLAPGIALVSDVASECRDLVSQKVKRQYDAIADSLKKADIKVVRHPLALSCPQESLRRKNPDVTLRSYTNLLVLQDAYLVPKYLPANGFETANNPNDKTILDSDNGKFVEKMQKLINDGVIPKKKIIQMPITQTQVEGGSGFRCLSWEIPDDLSSCNQHNFDLAMIRTTKELQEISNCMNSPNAELCKLARAMYDIVQTTIKAPEAKSGPVIEYEGYQDEFDSLQGLIKANKGLLEDLISELNQLADKLKNVCH